MIHFPSLGHTPGEGFSPKGNQMDIAEQLANDILKDLGPDKHARKREDVNTSDYRNNIDENFDGWLTLTVGTNDTLKPTDQQLINIREASRTIFLTSEIYKTAIRCRKDRVIGDRLTYSVIPDDQEEEDPLKIIQSIGSDNTIKNMMENWKRFRIVNNLDSRLPTWYTRCDRDGEAIIRLFSGEVPLIRFVDPTPIKDNPNFLGRTQNGVVFKQGDIESVESYSYQDPITTQFTEIKAADIVHTKFSVDFDVTRGIPTGYPVLTNIRRAEKLLQNASKLVQIQTAIALIRKHTGTTKPKMGAFQQRTATGTRNIDGQTRQTKRFIGGTVLDASENLEYDFPAHKISSESWVNIMHEELRRVSVQFSIPLEWLIGDYTQEPLLEDSPYAAGLRALQADFYRSVEDLFWKVQERMGINVEEARLKYKFQIHGPAISIPKPLDQARINDTEIKHSVNSPQNWARSLGRNYNIMRAEVIKHRETKQEGEQFPGDVGNTAGSHDGVEKENGEPRGGEGEGRK